MNDAIFAIPGLMPPMAPKYRSQLKSPEDGSLALCVHCGVTGDEVFYAIHVGGYLEGIIKDPSYDYGPRLNDYISAQRYPQLMTVSDTLPPDAIVPKHPVHGCPIPITERPDLEDEDKLYWIINLPPRTLPVGVNEIQVTINGRLRKYVVSRPAFKIHALPDITKRLRHCTHQDNELLDVAFEQGHEDTIILDLRKHCNEAIMNAEFRASAILHGETIELPVEAVGPELHITIPAQETHGYGLWKAEYKAFDDWLQLAAGDLIITPTSPSHGNS